MDSLYQCGGYAVMEYSIRYILLGYKFSGMARIAQMTRTKGVSPSKLHIVYVVLGVCSTDAKYRSDAAYINVDNLLTVVYPGRDIAFG
jgi:hypothetical protein